MSVNNAFESEQDRVNERKVIETFVKSQKKGITKDVTKCYITPKFTPVDAGLMDDKEHILAFVEVKCRNIPSHRFDTYKQEIPKWLELVEYDKLVPTYLVVRWTDKIGFLRPSEVSPSFISVLKRRQMRYDRDEQLAVEIPIKEFTLIEKGDK